MTALRVLVREVQFIINDDVETFAPNFQHRHCEERAQPATRQSRDQALKHDNNQQLIMSKITKALFLATLLFSHPTLARDYIRMAGSSTVYPFARTMAEEFGRNTEFKTPIVESTGTGGGIKLFCLGVGENFIDFANASRKIEESELSICQKNGVKNVVGIKIGYDGIVLANSTQAKPYNLTKQQIFLALAQKIPSNGKLIENPYKKWSDIDKSLPNNPIAVYGPPPTSGTRDAFVELVMEEPCVNNPAFIAAEKDAKKRKKNCHIIRSDGKFIEAGENDNLIIQKLKNDHNALGIFGFSFLEQNAGIIHGARIDDINPSFQNIATGKYKVSRPLFIYFKKEHLPLIKGIREFILEITSFEAIGEEGYLIEKGLIPAHKDEIKKMREEILGGL
ncbi:MAG: phosphate transporter substrate-binding protein PhoT family [Rickettsiaceae bacterium]|jgi:phosphate transport system substrate-binding protein|nr:phosphate transporter substrate-binding protein PhoT family [Rickettsiaceae bacterium]